MDELPEHRYAVAFPPEGSKAREVMRGDLAKQIGLPIPADYPDAKLMPCTDCGMELSVGPKLQEKIAEDPKIKLICPYCLKAVYVEMCKQGASMEIKDLGNVNSMPEGPSKWGDD